MRRSTVWACALAAPFVLAFAAAAGPQAATGEQRGMVWVTNRALNDITIYDAPTGGLVATIPVGREPNDVTVARGTGKAYVTNEADNSISIVSLGSRTVIATIPVGARPHHIESSIDGRTVVFGVFGTNRLGVIDTATDRMTEYAASTNPVARTHQVWPADDGLVFAANEVTNDIGAVDTRNGQIVFTIGVGTRPSEVLVTRDLRTAYVSVRGENKVKVFDLTRRALAGEVVVGTEPDTLQLTPDGRTLVVALRGRPAQIVYVDTLALAVRKTVDVAGAGTLAGHQWLSADGAYTFTAFEGGSAPGVAVVDNGTMTVVRTDPYPGGGRPHGLHLDDPDRSAAEEPCKGGRGR